MLYLASSEELLRGLNQTEDAATQDSTASELPQNRNATSWHHYLLTPLGVAGILIFLLSGTLLSIIMINFGQTYLSNSASSNPLAKVLKVPPNHQKATRVMNLPLKFPIVLI